MSSWLRRFASLVGALVLLAGAVSPSSAQESATVTVSGQIVAAPLSISIGSGSVNFGSIDHKATPQTPSASSAGFVSPSGGAYWFANAPIVLNVNSPTSWTGGVCRTDGANVPDGGFRLSVSLPQSQSDANTAFGGNAIPPCGGTPLTWMMGSQGSVSPERYLGVWVQSDDTIGSFSTVLTFSVSTSS